jgi:hypothetical protein
MQKITLNSIILGINILFLFILLTTIVTDIYSLSLSLLVWSMVYIVTFFILKWKYLPKLISDKSLSYFIFIFTSIFFASFLIRAYFPHSISFLADYDGDFYEFLDQYRFTHSSIPYFRLFIETIQLYFVLDILFAVVGSSMLAAICMKIFSLEKEIAIRQN